MQLIIGLGNPGEEYLFSRHNVGFEIVDSIYSYFRFPEFKLKFSGLISIKKIFNNNIILFKPQKFMNLSGEPTNAVIKKTTSFCYSWWSWYEFFKNEDQI